MKAAILKGIDNMIVGECEKPVCDGDSMLVRVRACAVCGSDIRIFHSGNSRVEYPAIIGHEMSGEVAEIGERVRGYKIGDRIAIGADVPCGECETCRAGYGNNCQINYAMGYQFSGGFAEYVLLNRTVMLYGPIKKLGDKISYPEAALAEPLGCVINALSLTPVKLGETAVVIGAGPIGMMLCEVLKAMGAACVILINRSKPRLEMAKEKNIADLYCCSGDEDSIKFVLDNTKGTGADVIFTANSSSDTQKDALVMAKNRGKVNFFGGLPRNNSLVTLDTNIIHYKELIVSGAHGATPKCHAEAVSMIESGRIDVKKFITHKFSLDKINEAFKAAEEHGGLRVVVEP